MKLAIADCLNLEIEIGGYKDQEGKVLIKGLLNEPLPLKTKYWINKLLTKLSSEKKAFTDSRDSLIKELGQEKEDGSFEIPIKIGEELNPKYAEFNKQMEELLSQEIEIDINQFKIEDFDFQSESNYTTFLTKCIEI